MLATALLGVVVALLSLLATRISLLATLTLAALLLRTGPGILVSGLARMLPSALLVALLLVVLIRCVALLGRIVFVTRLILIRILMSLLRCFSRHDVSPFDLTESTAQTNC
jgi:hypothetical protein